MDDGERSEDGGSIGREVRAEDRLKMVQEQMRKGASSTMPSNNRFEKRISSGRAITVESIIQRKGEPVGKERGIGVSATNGGGYSFVEVRWKRETVDLQVNGAMYSLALIKGSSTTRIEDGGANQCDIIKERDGIAILKETTVYQLSIYAGDEGQKKTDWKRSKHIRFSAVVGRT